MRWSWLAGVFVLKMAVTIGWFIGCWLSVSFLAAHNLPVSEPPIFLRLLALAYAGLELGYFVGFVQTLHGRRAAAPIAAGIVSNGGSLLVLLYFGLGGAWATWRSPAPEAMWLSVVALAIITAGLIIFGGHQLIDEWRSLRSDRPA